MSELDSEHREVRVQPQKRGGSGVVIAIIVAVTLVSLACIAASTAIVYMFFQNPPW